MTQSPTTSHRHQHAPVSHAGSPAAHARSRDVLCAGCRRCEWRPHLLGSAFCARRSARRLAGRARRIAGVFDRTQPVLGTPNEQVLTKVVGPQIADLYGTMMRSTPVFFLQDDHDYFENDEADDTLVTFPPDPFMLNVARASQLLYLPGVPAGQRTAVWACHPDRRRIGPLESQRASARCVMAGCSSC